MAQPTVLILGGTGFIGKNLVQMLVEKKLVKKVRVADKSLPALAYLTEEQKACFDNKEVVEFKQCDLTKPPHVERAFADEKFDYVINLCGETRFGLHDQEYKDKCVTPAVGCGKAAADMKVQKWVEVSTAQIYEAQKKKPATEEHKLKPWTRVAANRLAAEDELKKLDLPLVILRPSIVYGQGDLTGLMPRVVCAAVYQARKEKMKFLWDKSLRVNSVHISDMVEAIWLACTTVPAGAVYNISDPSDLNQGDFNAMLGKIFGIDVGFLGSIASNVVTKLSLSTVASEANDKHVPGWTTLCTEHKINTPLSPYLDKELLSNNSLCVDGSKITTDHGFKYTVPAPTEELLTDMVNALIKQKLFPPVLGAAAAPAAK
jgi:nucleoside-diphosphate-sugar epimerase